MARSPAAAGTVLSVTADRSALLIVEVAARAVSAAAVSDALAMAVGARARAASTGGADGATLADHAEHFAWHASLWRGRIPTVDEIEPELTATTESLAAEIAAPGSLAVCLAGVYSGAAAALADAIESAASRTDPRLDGPTARVLSLIGRDLGIDLVAGGALVAALLAAAPEDQAAADAHVAAMHQLVVSALGVVA